MSELPELPPAPRRVRPLMQGGLEAAIASGRRRRQRVMAATGGAGAALILVVATVLVQPSDARPDSLQFAETPTPAPTVVVTELEPTPGPDVPDAPPLDGAAPAGSPGGVGPAPGAQPAPGAAGAPEAGRRGGGATRADAPAAESQPVPPAARPAFVEDTDEDAEGAAACASAGMAADAAGGGASCTYSSGGPTPEIVRRGELAQIVLGYCTSSNDIGDHIFYFNGGQEKDVVVVDENDEREEVFRFSSTVRYVQGAHEQRLRPGKCIQWTGRWNLLTTSGKAVTPGTYRVTMRVRADREVYQNGPAVETPLDTTVSARFTVVD